MVEIAYKEKISDDFYFVAFTDGTTAVLSVDAKILKK